jgi:hypothetical protein
MSHPDETDQGSPAQLLVTRTAHLGVARIVVTPIPEGSFLMRLHPDPGPHYDRMIVVTPQDGGKTLHLAGWIGPPLSPSEWLIARDTLFPDATDVEFERMREDGSFSYRTLKLP